MRSSNIVHESSQEEHLRKEIERTNAKLRHFRGVAVGVLQDAENVWEEICSECNDPRTCEQIIDGIEVAEGRIPACGWPEFREKLHLLGHYLQYTKRLLEG